MAQTIERQATCPSCDSTVLRRKRKPLLVSVDGATGSAGLIAALAPRNGEAFVRIGVFVCSGCGALVVPKWLPQ